MQAEQIQSIVSEIKKYDQSFDLVSMLQKKLDDLKYRDSIKNSLDGKLALFLEKYFDSIYLEYWFKPEPAIYTEISDKHILDVLTGFCTLRMNIDKDEHNEETYYFVTIYTETDKFLKILEQLGAHHTIKKIMDHSCQ